MSWAKGLAAIAGGLKGVQTSVEREDEIRLAKTDQAFKVALKNAEYAKDLAKEAREKTAKERNAVDTLTSTVNPTTGAPFTKEEATAVYDASVTTGENISDIVKKYNVKAGKQAKLTQTPGTKYAVAGGVSKTSVDEGEESIFSVARGRAAAVESGLLEQMKAAGLDTEVEIPGKTSVSGVTLTPIADTDVNFDDAYLIDSDGIPTEQVTVKRTLDNRTNKVTVQYLSKTSGEEIKVGDNQRVSSSAEAFDNKPFLDFGPLVSLTSDGAPEQVLDENGNVVYGYLMRNGEVRARRAGTISNEIVADAIVAGRDWASSIAGGDLSTVGKFEKLPSVKEFRKESADMRVTKTNNNLLFFRSEKRLDLHTKYGNRMYGPAGAFADFVTGTSKFVDGVVVIVNGLEDLANSDASLEEKIQFLESGGNIQELERIVDQQDTFLDQYIGTAQEIAMARVLDAALATVTAYDLAKQTGDTRISNNDFDQYIKTVSGNNAEQTVNLIKQGLESNLDIYKSKYENFTITKNSIPQYVESTYLDDINRQFNMYDTPQKYENRINTMFKPFEEKRDKVRVIKTDDFEVMPVKTDADGKQTRKVVMKDGTEFILRNPRFMDAGKEIIQQAIQKRLEAQAAAAQN